MTAGEGGAPDSEPVVDLRSDTVTRPTTAMREAIARARVGDDVLGDDPTVARLETVVAELLGKERSLFFPSGTMANQVGLAVLGRPGTGVIVEARTHIVHREAGAAAALSGLQLRPVPTPDGILTPERAREVIQRPSRYLVQDTVLAVENTHMDAGGRVMPLDLLQSLKELARERGMAVHLDGARLWNAATAAGVSLAELAGTADTVMVSLSKGLGAPVGSMLAGDGPRMAQAWHVRRRFGGGMRQSGILAAAALHALEHHLGGLGRDHDLAGALARGVRELPGLHAADPDTNIVFVEIRDEALGRDNLLKFLENRRILMSKFGPRRLRAVTHLDVDRQGITRTLAAMADAVAQT